jgi:hypothetical protein
MDNTEIVFLIIVIVYIGVVGWLSQRVLCETHNSAPSNNFVRSNNPLNNNTYGVQLLETLAQPDHFSSIYLEAARQQLPENGNSNVTTATTIFNVVSVIGLH